MKRDNDSVSGILIIVIPSSPSETSQTNDGIRSRPATQAYANGWDTLWGGRNEGTAKSHRVLN